MSKTRITKLRLTRETLMPLDGTTLENVAGGTPFARTTTCPPGQQGQQNPGPLGGDFFPQSLPKPQEKITDILTRPVPYGSCFCPPRVQTR